MAHYLFIENDEVKYGKVTDSPIPPQEGMIEVDRKSFLILTRGFGLIKIIDGVPVIPHDDRRVFKELYGSGAFSGSEILQNLVDIRELQAFIKNDTPEGMKIIPPAKNLCRIPWVPYQYEIPNLALREFTLDDLDKAAALSVETGLYPEKCSGISCKCNPPEAHAFMRLGNKLQLGSWPLALVYKDQPIQFEIVRPDIPLIHYTAHLTRERPHWFWREAEKPVFQALVDMGYTKAQSRARKDRPDWIAQLQAQYGAKKVLEMERTILMEYPLDMNHFTGWPERKSLGKGWSYSRDGIEIREISESELQGIKNFINDVWGNNPRKNLCLKMFDEWYDLDRATMLAGSKGGKLIWVRSMRNRRGTIGSMTNFIPMDEVAPEDLTKVNSGMLVWSKLAGYNTITHFIDQHLYDRNKALYDRLGSKIVTKRDDFRIPMYELAINVGGILGDY